MEDLFRENQTVIIGAVVVALVMIAWRMLKPRPKTFAEDMTLNVRCRKCRWQGTVTRYNKVCPKCNGTDLQDLGR